MIVIDYKDRRAIYEQVAERFQELIVKGVLRAGEQMPSVRSLAMELSINPNTIQKAYAELERRGFTYTIKGRGSFVAARDDFLSFKQEEVLGRFRKDVEAARDLQVEERVLTDIIRGYYGLGGSAESGESGGGESVAGENMTGENAVGANAAGENTAGENVSGKGAARENGARKSVTGKNATGENAAGGNTAGESATGANVSEESASAENNAAGTRERSGRQEGGEDL